MREVRKKPNGPWIVVLLIGLTVLYVASFWPVCSLVGNGFGHERVTASAYYPLLFATIKLPKSVSDSIFPVGGDAAEGVILMALSVGLLDFHSRGW
jgi:hypothetical protein